jgi:arylsulfatase A-like enzyme
VKLLTILGALFLALAVEASVRPNFVILFSDDQRADTLGAWGNRNIHTPNLDRLVSRGFSFRGNYCFGSNSGAVCIPSRAMLMSGRRWFDVKSDLSGTVILPEWLGQRGYTTFGTGKWHNERPSFARGFQRGKAVFFGGMADHTKVPVVDWDGSRFGEARVAPKFSSETFADAAVEFLEGYRGEQPFFCYVAFTAPHDPRNPPEVYREMYYRKRPPLPVNFLPKHPFDQGWVMNLRDENLAAYPRTRQAVSDQLCEYYGLISHLDEQIGRILRTLEETPHAANTYVIFAADSGLAMGSHGLLGKQSVYEHSMRSALVVAGPGVPKGKTTRAFTYLLDLFPTIAEVVGEPGPAGVGRAEPEAVVERNAGSCSRLGVPALHGHHARGARRALEVDCVPADQPAAVVRLAARSRRDPGSVGRKALLGSPRAADRFDEGLAGEDRRPHRPRIRATQVGGMDHGRLRAEA